MPSLSFDPVAHIYDATRGYPVEVAQSIAQAIETTAAATPATSFLEVGIGTGRIAFPLAALPQWVVRRCGGGACLSPGGWLAAGATRGIARAAPWRTIFTLLG